MNTASSEVTEKQQKPEWLKWEESVWKFVVSEMKRRKVSYKELSRRLEKIGIDETPDRLNRKINRRRFPATFLLACCQALEIETLDLKVVSPKQQG